MARKPLSEKTVALNVLRWGTGGINIDDSRVDNSDMKIPHNANELQTDKPKHHAGAMTGTIGKIQVHNSEGRFPANIIFDEEAGQVLDQQSGFSKTNCKSGIVEGKEANIFNDGLNKTTGHKKKMIVGNYKDEGGASRFFYCPKASKKDRDEGLDVFDDKERYTSIGQRDGTSFRDNGTQILPAICKNNHPTVKPTALMEYLIKLVTPKGGTVMDCFLGSGSTGKAAVRNGFDFIGIERDEEYIKIAEARIKNELNG
jgi:site-specific DNA-methyltransferase (adenine-specific)